MRMDWKNNPELLEKGLKHWLDIIERKLRGESIPIVKSLLKFYSDLGYELRRSQVKGLIHVENGVFVYHLKREYDIDLDTKFRSWQKKGLKEFLDFKQKLESLIKYVEDTDRDITQVDAQKESETMTFVDAAYRVLKDNGKPMHYKDITQQALNKGYIETKGKTPEATMTARISHDIKKEGKKSRFVRVERGIYGLSEWDKEPTEPKPEEPVVELDHEELIRYIMVLGEIEGYNAINEYSCDRYRLDVVWLKEYSNVPKYCFEIHISGNLEKDIASLKNANDKWNSKIFLISEFDDIERAEDIISGSFHEIKNKIEIRDAKEILEYCQFKEKFKEINGLFK